MMRKLVMALTALGAISLAGTTAALAHGPGGHFGGGHFGGGHFGGGHFGGHFSGFHHGGFHRNVFVGFGFGSPYYGGYPYYDNYDDSCYLVRRRVLTPYGWRIRRVEVCG